MIDTRTETLLSLTKASELLGKHVTTIYRWTTDGMRGVVLESIQVGATRCTSREAIQSFCEQLTNEPARTTTRVANGAEKAAKELERHGI